ncbi:type II secretion system protein GspD, partial [Candidatus Symbiopectobacterium sp. NZEC135]|nr:type II secretion system protein GspD [Candidatus Symbiopectobacterium sp. NZEC135]
SVADSASSSSSELGVTFNTRTVSNAVLVGNGETVVVGGLLDKSTTESASRVPILGDIPVIGALFRSNSKQVKKRNLMLFIRPTIIRDRQQYQTASSDKYRSFSEERGQQREGDNRDNLLHDKQLRLPGSGNTHTFLQVKTAITALYPTGGR